MNKHVVEKESYVETLNKALSPLVDFGSAEYKYVHSANAEMLRLNDSMGGSKFMNVTGYDCESILLSVMELLFTGKSNNLLTSKESRRAAMEVFEQGA